VVHTHSPRAQTGCGCAPGCHPLAGIEVVHTNYQLDVLATFRSSLL